MSQDIIQIGDNIEFTRRFGRNLFYGSSCYISVTVISVTVILKYFRLITYSGIIDACQFGLGSLQHEESSEVSSVRGYDDHSKSGPHHSQHSC